MRWCMLGAMLVRLASSDDDLYGYGLGYRDDENAFSCSDEVGGFTPSIPTSVSPQRYPTPNL